MIYLIGSLRNPEVQVIANKLRADGFEVFDDYNGSGEQGDWWWEKYERQRGKNFIQALASPFAQNTFQFDKRHLDQAKVGVLVLPAGKSGHLELGYMIGQGKPGFILLDKEPERMDVMYNFATAVVDSYDGLVEVLKPKPSRLECLDCPECECCYTHGYCDCKPYEKRQGTPAE